jgi:hypothetical protein
MFPNWFIPVGRPGIALGGGMLMIVYRFILYSVGQGPMFDAENVIIMEPLYLLFGLMLTTVYLEKMESGGLFDRLRLSLDDPINWCVPLRPPTAPHSPLPPSSHAGSARARSWQCPRSGPRRS